MTASTLRIKLQGTLKLVQVIELPCNKPVPLDFPGVQNGSKMELELEDSNANIYGYSEFAIPDAAFKTREIQVNQQIQFNLKNSSNGSIYAKIFIIFLNADILQRPSYKNTLVKTPSKSTKTQKSNNKCLSTPQKKEEINLHKRQKTEEKLPVSILGRLPELISEEIEIAAHGSSEIYNQVILPKPRNILSSRGSIEIQPNVLIKLSNSQEFSIEQDYQDIMASSPKDTPQALPTLNEKIQEKNPLSAGNQTINGTLLSKSSGNFSDYVNGILSKVEAIETSTQLDTENSFPYIPTVESEEGYAGQINSGFYLNNNKKIAQGDSKSLATIINKNIAFENGAADMNCFQTFCPNYFDPAKVSKTEECLEEFSFEKTRESCYEKSLDDDGKRMILAKKRRRPNHSVAFDKDATYRLSYTQMSFYRIQVEQLQNALLVKESQLKVYETLRQENEELKAALIRSEEARKNLQNVNCESAKEVKKVNQEIQSHLSTVISEKEAILNKNMLLQCRIGELEKIIQDKESNLRSLENKNFQKNIEINEIKNLTDKLQNTQKVLESLEQKRKEEKKNYIEAFDSCQKGVEETRTIAERLIKEKRDMEEEIRKVRQELEQEKTSSQALRDELLLTQKSLQNAQSFKLVLANEEARNEEISEMLSYEKKAFSDLQNLLETTKAEFLERLRASKGKEEEHLDKIDSLKGTVKEYEAKTETLLKEMTDLKLRVSELITEESALEQLICVNKDMEQKLNETNLKLTQTLQEKERLREQILAMSQGQESIHFKLLQAKKTANELQERLNEREEYIRTLKRLLAETKESQAKYVPFKDDPVDIALAKYLNGRNNIGKLKFLFIRENSGTYQFGTKRLSIKLEGDQLIIRVGGGYLTIDEFIDQNLHLEAEKAIKNGTMQGTNWNFVLSKVHAERNSHSAERCKTQGC